MAMREDMYKGFKFNRKTMPTVIISLIILPVSVWAIADYDLVSLGLLEAAVAAACGASMRRPRPEG